MDAAHRVWPVPCPGPATPPTELSGAYEVHPASGGPSPTKKERISTTKATNVTQKDIILKRGKAMSSAPTLIGRKKFSKAPNGAGVSTKKTKNGGGKGLKS